MLHTSHVKPGQEWSEWLTTSDRISLTLTAHHVGLSITLLTCTWEATGLNLTQDTIWSGWFFCDSHQYLQMDTLKYVMTASLYHVHSNRLLGLNIQFSDTMFTQIWYKVFFFPPLSIMVPHETSSKIHVWSAIPDQTKWILLSETKTCIAQSSCRRDQKQSMTWHF